MSVLKTMVYVTWSCGDGCCSDGQTYEFEGHLTPQEIEKNLDGVDRIYSFHHKEALLESYADCPDGYICYDYDHEFMETEEPK